MGSMTLLREGGVTPPNENRGWRPHHCWSLVQPLLCALLLPSGFGLFIVTKILSRSILRKYLRGFLPLKVPSGVPLGYFITGGQCPSFQSPSKHPSHQTLHNCHIMCPNFFSRLPSCPSTFWGTPWLLYNWWTMSIFPTTSQLPFTPNPSHVPYHVSKNSFQRRWATKTTPSDKR